MAEERYSWIYSRPYTLEDSLKNRIESAEVALGFKLFFWQWSYILNGDFRQYGETTAKILRELLLDPNAEPLDFTKPTGIRAEIAYRSELIRVYRTLREKGVRTRTAIPKDLTDQPLSQTIRNVIQSMISGTVLMGKEYRISKEDILKEMRRQIEAIENAE